MSKKSNLDETTIRHLYYDENMSKTAIAQEMGVSVITLDKYFKRYGIKTKRELADEQLTYDVLYQMYVIDKKSCAAIGRHFDCHSHTIKAKLIEYGLRERGGYKNSKQFSDNEISEIIAFYNDTRSIVKVGEEFNISTQVVSDILKENGVHIGHGGGLPKVEIPKDALEELYVNQGLAVTEIAEKLGVKRNVVDARLAEYGILSHVQQVLASIPKEELYDLYIEQNMNQQDLAEHFGVGLSTIQTALKRHGIEKDITTLVAKRESTCMSKYGYKNPGSIPEIQEKVKETNLANFGVTNPAYREITNIDEWNDFENYIQSEYSKNGELFYYDVGSYFSVCQATLMKKIRETGTKKFFSTSFSKPELEWKEWLEKNNIHYIPHDRKTCAPLELDFYLPEYNIAIEINPTITHNSSRSFWAEGSQPKKTTYHKQKAELCEQKGINLISVFDWYDVNKLQDIIQTHVQNNKRIYARKTIIKEITSKEANSFLELNHLQGKIRAKYRYGLYSEEDELVAVMTFGKARYGNKDNADYEMLRYCSKCGLNVVGGASKLFTHFVREHQPKKIISFCNYDISNGNMYKALGFKYERHSQPSYYWCNIYGTECYSWYLINAKGVDNIFGTSFGKGTKNDELMLAMGYVKVYNCGSKVYIWENQD